MRSSGDGGHNRENHGTPVSMKGPISKAFQPQPHMTYTDAQAAKAAGYKGVTVNKRITK